MKKTLIMLIAISLVVLLSGGVFADVIKFSYGGPGNLDSDAHVLATVVKSHIETATNGEFEVKLYPQDQLGDARERIEILQQNVTHINISTTGGLGQFYDNNPIFAIPFAEPNSAVFWEVMDGEFGNKLRADITEKIDKVSCLALTESGGFCVFTNNKRPIKTVEDMEGLSFRILEEPIQKKMFDTLGASATPIAWTELYTSLQTGVIDGQHNPVPIINYGKLYEVQKYATISNHLNSPMAVLVNTEWWENLSDKNQDIIATAIHKGKVAGRGRNMTLMATEGIEILKENGMEVNTLKPEERQKFAEITQPVILEHIEKDYGEETYKLAKEYLDAVEKAKKEVTNIDDFPEYK